MFRVFALQPFAARYDAIATGRCLTNIYGCKTLGVRDLGVSCLHLSDGQIERYK